MKVKAFSLDKLKKQDLDAVQETIDVQVHIMRASGSPESFEGQVRYHEGTGLLIASGAHDYVELATTIIEAFEVTLSRRRPEGFPE